MAIRVFFAQPKHFLLSLFKGSLLPNKTN